MLKKISLIMIVGLLFGCASEIKTADNRSMSSNYSYNNSYQSCPNCCTKSYTVRKPVEVIYKDITYTTVYEPKTYQSVKYTRKPYDRCDTDLCK